jgi:Holliday junction resolvase RusA-like endonuclease
MSITIKIAPLSINKAYRGRRFKTPEYEKWSKDVAMLLPKSFKMPEAPYEMEIVFGFSNKASDVDNGNKTFIDLLQTKYKFNDKEIYKLVSIKKIVKKGQEYITFKVKTYDTTGNN